jgi:hypothetical protein
MIRQIQIPFIRITSLLILAFGIFPAPGYAGDWERVYPEEAVTTDELPFLTVGYREQGNPAFLVGSRTGYALVPRFNVGGALNEMIPVKLPFSFDVEQVASVNERWVVAGPGGKVAIHDSGEDLQSGWTVNQIPGVGGIDQLAVVNGTLLVLSGEDVYISEVTGSSWRLQEGLYKVKDLATFRGKLYAIRSVVRATFWDLELICSEDGISWNRLWSFRSHRVSEYRYLREENIRFMVTYDETDSTFMPDKGSERLWVIADLEDGKWSRERYHLKLSTKDGSDWVDHKSRHWHVSRDTGPSVESAIGSWNPLDLDKTRINFETPLYEDGNVAGNLFIMFDYLLRFQSDGWTELIESHPRRTTERDTTVIWDKLTFIYDNETAVRISKEDSVEEVTLPDVGSSSRKTPLWKQMVVVNGTYTALSGNISGSGPELDAIRFTSDFQTWDTIPFPQPRPSDASLRLHNIGNTLNATFEHTKCTYYPGGHGHTVCETRSYWQAFEDGTWLEAGSTPFYSFGDKVFLPRNGNFYRLEIPNSETRSIWFYSQFGGPPFPENDTYKAALKTTYPQLLNNLVSPDGKKLVAYGDTSTLVIVEEDGATRESNPWHLFPSHGYWVEHVVHVNGWYYVLGPVLLRTKDFRQYESLPLPNNEPILNLVGFNRNLYGFTSSAVYRQPMEPGFLDSVEVQKGWHHADWLGWFQIIDEDLGDIDHLLLGKCWVKQTSDLEYWIRTEPLGWIYMRKDWAPWLYRLDDGHWYWLDQDSWPPRAWDDVEKEWEELRP